jgi:hypothetical protein
MAIAVATATFAATDTASFTWSPALTTNPPTVLYGSVDVTDGKGPVVWQLFGAPTNVGGTVRVSAPFTGTVTLSGSD